MASTETPVILIVEDEPDVAETYERWLQSDFDVRRAASGPEALGSLDETVDVVLLDRMMAEVSGGEVLSEIRNRGVDCRVAMVSAVNPDFDVIEMGFDAYVTKPPEREELRATIDRLLDRATLDDEFQEYYSLVARRSALQAEKTEDELMANDKYADLVERIESKRKTVDADLGDLATDMEFIGAVREIMEDENPPAGEPTSNGNRE